MSSDLWLWLALRFEGVIAVVGLLMIAAGFALINIPTALIVTGAILLLLAVWPPGGKRNGTAS